MGNREDEKVKEAHAASPPAPYLRLQDIYYYTKSRSDVAKIGSFADISFKFKKSSRYGTTTKHWIIHIRGGILLHSTAHVAIAMCGYNTTKILLLEPKDEKGGEGWRAKHCGPLLCLILSDDDLHIGLSLRNLSIS
jgi:hypothetical protein